jgi:hypothetical protein
MRQLGIDIGIINCGFCLTEFDDANQPNVIYCECLAFGRYKDSIGIIINGIHRVMKENHEIFATTDKVIIEQQMGAKSSKNFAISSVLYYHFAQLDKTVMFMNPVVKFNYVKTLAIDSIEPLFETHKDLKKLSVAIATELAKFYDLPVLQEALGKYKKKDDICDSLLYSLVTLP